MPDDLFAGHLIDDLLLAGPVVVTFEGEASLTWQDVWAFGQSTGRLTSPWHHETLFRMSRAYLGGKREGAEPNSIPPVNRD